MRKIFFIIHILDFTLFKVNKTMAKNTFYSLLCITAFLLSSCSSNYKITAEFPTPLIQPISAYASLDITDEFFNYKFEETKENRNYLSVEIGEAQTALFSIMTEAMFTNEVDAEKQLIITPTILDFQYAIPRETRAEIYEIWIKYRVFLKDNKDQKIADWLITGYGKTPTAFLKSPQDAIQAAALIALRDVGSQLSIGFSRQPDIKLWLDTYSDTNDQLLDARQETQEQLGASQI